MVSILIERVDSTTKEQSGSYYTYYMYKGRTVLYVGVQCMLYTVHLELPALQRVSNLM